MFHEEAQKQEDGKLNSRTAFWAGFAGGVLVFCTLTFLVLLALVLKGTITISG